MPKVAPRNMWCAKVELEIERLALSCQYVEKGAGSKKKRCLVATDWLSPDGQTIMWDVGKRLKGWLKEQVATMKTSWRDRIQYGVVCKSLPQAGYTGIAAVTDIAPSRNWKSFKLAEDYELNGMPEPNVEVIMTDRGTSIFSLYYCIPKPIAVQALIYCFAYGVRPENVKEWLTMLGKVKGLGDMHNASGGYGCFEVKSFEIVEEKQLSF